MGDAMPMKERRKHIRVAVNKRVWISNFDENPSPSSLQDCLIVDISEGGACIQCSALYKEDQLIAFTYQDFMEEGFRPVAGVVTWSKQLSDQDYRYGIKFLGLNTQMLRRIQDIVVQAAEDAGPPEKAHGKQKRSRSDPS